MFLVQQAAAPFGAAEDIGDFSTNRFDNGSNTFTLIVGEAFAFNNAMGSRTNLNRFGFWFADPATTTFVSETAAPVTGFDGDASAGVQMMNSGARALP